MSGFLPLTDLYFRDSQTTETKENRCTCTYTQVYTRRTRLRCLRRREKIEATTQDANAIARANDGKREFGFPNELRLYGPEECVGILIKHQSGTTRMIEIVSSTTGAAEKSLRTSVEDPFPARIRSRSGRTDTRPFPFCATSRSLTIVFRGQQITFRVRYVIRPLILSACRLRRLIPSRFLHSSARNVESLLLFNPCNIAFSFYVSTKYMSFSLQCLLSFKNIVLLVSSFRSMRVETCYVFIS